MTILIFIICLFLILTAFLVACVLALSTAKGSLIYIFLIYILLLCCKFIFQFNSNKFLICIYYIFEFIYRYLYIVCIFRILYLNSAV